MSLVASVTGEIAPVISPRSSLNVHLTAPEISLSYKGGTSSFFGDRSGGCGRMKYFGKKVNTGWSLKQVVLMVKQLTKKSA
jgi:hypothetical protein